MAYSTKTPAHAHADHEGMLRKTLIENRTHGWLQFTVGSILATILLASLIAEVSKLRRVLVLVLETHNLDVCVEGEP